MRAIAFMFAYNEVDIIGWTIRHALEQGLHVHVTDNWSTDGTFALVRQLAENDPRVTVSQWPAAGPVAEVSWADMLHHVEALALKSGFDWCVHYDADEIRRSGRSGERLIDAITRLDAAGFNAIDHEVEVYVPHPEYDGTQNPELFLIHRLPEHMDEHNGQVKCWKQPPNQRVTLTRGGHRVDFHGIRIASERFVLKHYPLRSPEQAANKIRARSQRWAASDRAKGWHVQYRGAQVAIVTLTRFPDLFDRLRRSIDLYEPIGKRIVVTSGGAQIDAPGWEVVQGIEPFVFARNANMGLRAAGEMDVLLINGDCELVSPVLNALASISDQHRPGVLSPQIDGGVGNALQRVGYGNQSFYKSVERLAFVAVYLPAATRDRIGLLDERYTGYGGDDVEYCARARAAGLSLGITASAVVRHGFGSDSASTSFRRVMTEAERVASMRKMDKLHRRLRRVLS